VTPPRAADDFPMIRARMEELRRDRARPRAADDFSVIRARMEELRRERAQLLRSRSCRYRQSRDAGRTE
jgi:alkanesulfonate monooxygenase SsuD/methylene tetrahydromethanopterin reductase-like flavin-dependent oxidoreductase (luciferase family)